MADTTVITRKVVSAELREWLPRSSTAWLPDASNLVTKDVGLTSLAGFAQAATASSLTSALNSWSYAAISASSAVSGKSWRVLAAALVEFFPPPGAASASASSLRDPKGLAEAARKAARRLTEDQVTALNGGVAPNVAQSAELKKSLDAAEAAVTQAKLREGQSVADFAAAINSSAAMTPTEDGAFVRRYMIQTFRVLLQPFVQLTFLGLHMGSPSYYDQRVARWIAFNQVLHAMDTLVRVKPQHMQATDADLVSLSSAADGLRKTLVLHYTVMDAKASNLMDLYSQSANASKEARDLTQSATALGGEAQSRQTRVWSLQWNVARAEADARRARVVMVVWIIVLVGALAAVGALLAMDRASLAVLVAAGVLGAATLAIALAALIRWARWWT